MTRDLGTLERVTAAFNYANNRPCEAGNATCEQFNIYSVLAYMDDLDEIPGIIEEPVEHDGLVLMADADELMLGLKITEALGFDRSKHGILDKVGHEHQHATAMHAVGLRGVHVIRFGRDENGLVMCAATMPVGGPVTKLAFAATLAYPRRLSDSDQGKLRQIGYESFVDVAKRIRRSGADIPMPMSNLLTKS